MTEQERLDMWYEIDDLERHNRKVKTYTNAQRGPGREWELLLLEIEIMGIEKIRRKYGL